MKVLKFVYSQIKNVLNYEKKMSTKLKSIHFRIRLVKEVQNIKK